MCKCYGYAFDWLCKDGIDIVLVVLISCAAGILDALGNLFDGLDDAVTVDGEGVAVHGILRIGTRHKLGRIMLCRDIGADSREDDIRAIDVVLEIKTVLLIVSCTVNIQRFI